MPHSCPTVECRSAARHLSAASHHPTDAGVDLDLDLDLALDLDEEVDLELGLDARYWS